MFRFVLLSALLYVAYADRMVGGLTATRKADMEVQKVVDQVKSSLETQLGATYSTFKAISYRSQVVAGVNYFVKVKVGDGQYVHLNIYKPLPGQGDASLTAVQQKKKLEDHIKYFSHSS